MKRGSLIIIILLSVVILAFAWYLISPQLSDDVVNEESPLSGGMNNGSSTEVNISKEVNGTNSGNAESNILSSGTFMGYGGHNAAGVSKIIIDGNTVYLRFEDFEVTNGPDLKVYLSNDLEAKDFVDLGDLKGNVGNQNYDLTGIDYSSYKYVLVWCKAFSVLFGYAEVDSNK